uniref:Glycosyl transferase, family 9 n=1 Tax=mine drainage metagenome TaxID=410659 RepID=E6QIN0_9ZZZZ
MRLNTMRRLDRWAGIPLCLLATLWVRCLDFIHGTRPIATDRKPRRVLFLELSEMGTTVIAEPAMRCVRDNLGAEIFFAIFARNVESLHLIDAVPRDHILTLRDDNLWVLFADSLRFLLWTRRNRIDAVLDLELFSRFSALLTGLSGAPIRIGFHRFHAEGLYRGSMLTHRVSYNGHIHMAKNFLAMAHALTATRPELPYAKIPIADHEIQVTPATIAPEEIDAVSCLIRQVYPDFERMRIVLLNPNSSEMLPQRRWPRENFKRLAQLLVRDRHDTLVLITGSVAERDEALWMEAQINHPRVRSLAGMHSLRALLPLYAISHALVTNDSGPAHFSALTPIRSIVLFGPETPALYASLGNTTSLTARLACSPCVTAANQKNSACDDPVCMRILTPERVLDAVRAALESATQPVMKLASPELQHSELV